MFKLLATLFNENKTVFRVPDPSDTPEPLSEVKEAIVEKAAEIQKPAFNFTPEPDSIFFPDLAVTYGWKPEEIENDYIYTDVYSDRIKISIPRKITWYIQRYANARNLKQTSKVKVVRECIELSHFHHELCEKMYSFISDEIKSREDKKPRTIPRGEWPIVLENIGSSIRLDLDDRIVELENNDRDHWQELVESWIVGKILLDIRKRSEEHRKKNVKKLRKSFENRRTLVPYKPSRSAI